MGVEGDCWFTAYDGAGRPVLFAEPSAVDLSAGLSTLEQYGDLLHGTAEVVLPHPRPAREARRGGLRAVSCGACAG